LRSLLLALQNRNRELQTSHQRTTPLPLLVKLSPDLETNDLEMIVDVVKSLEIDGIIATNTTINRDNLSSSREEVVACGEGGLSGKPLRSRATIMIGQLYQLTQGKIPIIGVGGVFTAEDAWEKIGAGASLVQLYTGFIYQGPRIAQRINDGLEGFVKRAGFTNLKDAIGHQAK